MHLHAPARILPWTSPRDLVAVHPGAASAFGEACLLVSELLGSFGDNEFMNEILAAAKRLFLDPRGEIIYVISYILLFYILHHR